MTRTQAVRYRKLSTSVVSKCVKKLTEPETENLDKGLKQMTEADKKTL